MVPGHGAGGVERVKLAEVQVRYFVRGKSVVFTKLLLDGDVVDHIHL